MENNKKKRQQVSPSMQVWNHNLLYLSTLRLFALACMIDGFPSVHMVSKGNGEMSTCKVVPVLPCARKTSAPGWNSFKGSVGLTNQGTDP